MLTIDINTSIDIDADDLDKAIIGAAAENLLAQVNLTGRYGGEVPALIQAKLSEIVGARIEAMLDREVTQVDRYGGIVPGPKKTFRDVFADQAEAYLTERVDSQGRVGTGEYGRIPRLEYLIRQVGASTYETLCRQVGEQFKAALKEKAQAALASVVAQHVKTAGL